MRVCIVFVSRDSSAAAAAMIQVAPFGPKFRLPVSTQASGHIPLGVKHLFDGACVGEVISKKERLPSYGNENPDFGRMSGLGEQAHLSAKLNVPNLNHCSALD